MFLQLSFLSHYTWRNVTILFLTYNLFWRCDVLMVSTFDFGWNALGLSSDWGPLSYFLGVSFYLSFHSWVYTFRCTLDWQLSPAGKQLPATYWVKGVTSQRESRFSVQSVTQNINYVNYVASTKCRISDSMYICRKF